MGTDGRRLPPRVSRTREGSSSSGVWMLCGPIPISATQQARIAAYAASRHQVSRSPFGPDDECGMLNLMDAESRRAALREADAGRPFDLAVDFFVGMPVWTAVGDPTFQMWMSHTPAGNTIDNPIGVSPEQNDLVSYSGDCIAMYTHCGTHVDTFTHFGYHGKIWNGFSAEKDLGSRNWHRAGADKQPPVLARGILIDVAGAKGLTMLPDEYAISGRDLLEALKRQRTELRPGDVVLIRTGRMTVWPDQERFVPNAPGINREAAEFLAKGGAILVGSDSAGVEQGPSQDPENWMPVHCYLLAEAGIPLLEMANLEELAAEQVYEFAFLGSCLKIRGATGSPIRPIALPLRG